MQQWFIKNIFLFLFRIIITVACIITLQTVVHKEGYFINYSTLSVGAICLIVMIKIWTYSSKD